MQIVLNTSILAKFPTRDVFLARHLGGFELVFQFQGEILSAQKDVRRRYEITGARIQVQPRGGNTVDIGRALPTTPLVINQVETPQPLLAHFVLAVDLSPLQLELLESVRDGGDLHLRIIVDGLGSDGIVTEASMPQHPFDYVIPESTWVKILNAAGASQTILFEINVGNQSETGLSHPGAKHLAKAHKAFVEADWSTVITECRKVAENLEGGRLGAIKSEFMANAGKMAKQDRTTFLLVAIQNYCHMSAHSKESAEPIEFTRNDAKLILAMTASYLSWFAKATKEI